MKFIKTIAAFMAAGLMLTATGCAAGGSKAKEAMTDAVDSYLSKVLAGKPAKKLVDAKNEAGFDNLGSAQMDLLTIVMSKSAYEITDPKPGKDEGSLTVEFKYPDLDEISSKVTDSGVDALKNAIEASDEDDLKTKKIEFKLVLKEGDWLISKKSDSKFKSFLEDIVRDFRASGTTPTTTEPDIDPTDNSGSSSGLSKVGISMPTKDLMRWKHDGDKILSTLATDMLDRHLFKVEVSEERPDEQYLSDRFIKGWNIRTMTRKYGCHHATTYRTFCRALDAFADKYPERVDMRTNAKKSDLS